MSGIPRAPDVAWFKASGISAQAAPLGATAFAALYAAYLPKVFNYVNYRIPNAAVAEELTASIFEQALTQLHTYRPDKGAFSTWLFTIAHNRVVTYFRKTRREVQVCSYEELAEIAVEGASPEEALLQAEQFRQVQWIIQGLPEQEQQVLALKFGGEMSHQEIAGVLGLKANHVGVLAFGAVQKLREAMERSG